MTKTYLPSARRPRLAQVLARDYDLETAEGMEQFVDGVVEELAEGLDTRSASGFVYAVQDTTTGLVKLGCAWDIVHRMRGLRAQTPSPCNLRLLGFLHCDHALAAERFLHQRFAAVRRHGEWFAISTKDLAALEAIVRTTLQTAHEPHSRSWFNATAARVLFPADQ